MTPHRTPPHVRVMTCITGGRDSLRLPTSMNSPDVHCPAVVASGAFSGAGA